MAIPSDIIDRLAAKLFRSLKVIPKTGCIEFTGHRGKFGYGMIWLERKGERYFWTAHRAAWILARGPIPEGLCCLHHCDNPPCCNPDHLWIGTRTENAADRDQKGRTWKGPRPQYSGVANPNARLTCKQVRAIFRDKRTLREIATDYGVAMQTVHNIQNRTTHKKEIADL